MEYYYRDYPSLFSGSWDIPACITKGNTKADISQTMLKCIFSFMSRQAGCESLVKFSFAVTLMLLTTPNHGCLRILDYYGYM